MKITQLFPISVRTYITVVCSTMLLFSCSSTKKIASSDSGDQRGPKFLNGISVNPGESVSSRNKSYGYVEKNTEKSHQKEEAPKLSLNTETLFRKYAEILDVPLEKIKDVDLFEEVDNWYGTPYRYGGNTKNGIDCSAFSRTLFSDVYNLPLPRTAQEQYNYCKHIKKGQLKEGDLVFFHTTGGGRITHVGIYLQNGKFVHASTSSGVMISDLGDDYWQRTYRAAGRLAEKEVSLN